MLFEFESDYIDVDKVTTRNGTRTVKTRIVLNTDDESEVNKLGMAYGDVLVNYLDMDSDEIEKEWFEYSFDMNKPDLEGCKKYFNKYAEKILDCVGAIDHSAWDIFNYLKVEETFTQDYSGDDIMASALFPMEDN